MPVERQNKSVIIIAPSSPLDNRDTYVNLTKPFLTSHGIEFSEGKYVMADHLGFSAGTNEERLQDFEYAIKNANIAWAVDGGVSIHDDFHNKAEKLFPLIKKNGVEIWGYSDLEELQIGLWCQGIVSGFLPHAGCLPEWGDETVELILNRIKTGADFPGIPTTAEWIDSEWSIPGTASGRLLATGLMTLASIGSMDDPFLSKNGPMILFLEAYDLKVRDISYFLAQLRRSKGIDKVKGVVFGARLTGVEEDIYDEWANSISVFELVHRYLGDLGPLAFCKDVGHVLDEIVKPDFYPLMNFREHTLISQPGASSLLIHGKQNSQR